MAEKLVYLMNKLYKIKVPLVPGLIMRFLRIIYGCDIHYITRIGVGLQLPHNGLGIVINHNAVIGNNCKILQNVTIGGRESRGAPVIGNNVLIGAGAVVLGNVVIGDNVKIGANAVVLHSIPSNAVAVGIPARVKKFVLK